MSRPPVTRDCFKNQPMAELRAALPLELRLGRERFERIRRGFRPTTMEDRWFVFYEDGWLYLHRSWSGHCIFQIRWEQDGDEAVVREAWVSRDPAEYLGTDAQADLQQISWVLRNLFERD